MAIVRFAVETLAARMFPGLDVHIYSVGFDYTGAIAIDLTCEGIVPTPTPEVFATLHQTIKAGAPPIEEKVTLALTR